MSVLTLTAQAMQATASDFLAAASTATSPNQ
jgi:hypothetical protein